MDPALIATATGVLAMLIVLYLTWSIYREDPGPPQLREVARYIRNGAKTFLRRQYKTILFFVLLISLPVAVVFRSVEVVFSLYFGALLSLVAAYVGMNVAVRANVRTAKAAATSSTRAFTLAFRGGAVMGLSVVGLSLLGISVLYFFWGYRNPSLMVGYGFGASLAALFAQLGGGIFTKAADIGADLVGKIEQRIPEDDPRNPAVIADQVGDNVGDCAGRGSDLFESISDDYVTAMIIGWSLFLGVWGTNVLIFPLALGVCGVLATIAGTSIVRGWKGIRPIISFNLGLFVAAAIATVGAYISSVWLLDDIRIFYCTLSGVIASTTVGLVVQYYIGIQGTPVRRMADASKRGAGINIITGISYALQSPFLPFMTMIGAILFSYFITNGSLYGIVAANLGTDLAIGTVMAGDAFGPISDNAQGIVQMAGLSTQANGTMQKLDSTGNTTKAYAKAFATASGTVSTVVLFATYSQIVGLRQQQKRLATKLHKIELPIAKSQCSIEVVSADKTLMKFIEMTQKAKKEIKIVCPFSELKNVYVNLPRKIRQKLLKSVRFHIITENIEQDAFTDEIKQLSEANANPIRLERADHIPFSLLVVDNSEAMWGKSSWKAEQSLWTNDPTQIVILETSFDRLWENHTQHQG